MTACVRAMAEGRGKESPKPSDSEVRLEETVAENEAALASDVASSLLAGQSKSSSDVFLEFSQLQNPGEDKNVTFLVCRHCQCKVMRPDRGRLVEKEVRK